ncbi:MULTISPECIES: SMC-Scp complex subunit ScpB [unclassified Oleiphilus]|jgi:segregation and condensation protein B|uniref:SMC-Scp complex subunit ScpB n=3 Tax=Oleiphilus TaxID=141450 RepID=UPI0007C26663|nr:MULTISPECIES: SMC-Scp complex subunit ScpB [unclassified Oleiphilus]KZY46215.1 SMC-Scp complex subunit ScpB [Oleiphilus sp. HI0050]KZY80970.1 SMC-Scp complex subunit ScpB [Oleiphilus sp. HI0069]KZY82483.1 SMC-Scp complex subunit ScpB [Oleiphilus sp. HI0068]KZZ20369.1 SMC-Scp complex subunit ScpB [Oleiphilus sp. HI0081]KZZ32317.1 SMC-Scp complex subunit ScpB [Oleiphilus sp. HI0085]
MVDIKELLSSNSEDLTNVGNQYTYNSLEPTVEVLKPIVEALLFSAGKPLSIDAIQALLEPDLTPTRAVFRSVLQEIEEDYKGRGVELVEFSGAYRFQSRPSMSEWVQRLWEERPQKYSRALLETLALIAYRQPITRGDIEEVRGVAVSSTIMKTLLERNWVRVVGHREVPGRPAIYATTKHFLSYFNLSSLDDLPTLAEIRDIELISKELNAQLELVGTEDESVKQDD